jgi:hypothetical protein
MNLRQLAIRVDETGGLIRQANLRALRMHLRASLEVELLRQIKDIDTSRHLRILWEAGLSSTLQKAVTDRLEQIK